MAHESRISPVGVPKMILPTYEQESVAKLKTTISKLAAYLAKSGATGWWEKWMKDLDSGQAEQEEQLCVTGECN